MKTTHARTARLLVGIAILAGCAAPALPVVESNDNRVSAGTLENGVLTLNLVVAMARWYPEDSGGSFTELPVFVEEGQRPQIPAPLIRVPLGTRVRVTVRNALADSVVKVFGFNGATAGADSTTAVAPGETQAFDYAADAAGTFLYSARSTTFENPEVSPETEQLAGALVVDAPGERTDDRIIVMNITSVQKPDSTWREALAMNGRSWPHTERFETTVGDTLRWRIVNGSMRSHPMHLHGAYFRVDAHGTGTTDTTYMPAQQRMVVTEHMRPLHTMRITWTPDEPGNWLFHCHLSFHVVAEARLDPPKDGHMAMMSGDPGEHMSGLVMGISVRPRAGDAVPDRSNARRLSLYVVPGVASDTSRPRPIALMHPRDGRAPDASAVRAPSEMIVLTRGEMTDITVHNRLDEATAIHWHGLELESWSDGVPGWSGSGMAVAPPIAPADSFVARLTLKRAGTFIHHTHLNDVEQLTTGLYGALVVLEPGERWDPARDFVFVAGGNAPIGQGVTVNGASTEPPIEMRVGQSYRLRFINILPAGVLPFQIRRGDELAEWRALAKDGFALPAHQAVNGPALARLSVGMTFDAEFTPRAAGTYLLKVPAPPTMTSYERQLIVR